MADTGTVLATWQMRDAHGRTIEVSDAGGRVRLRVYGERAELDQSGADEFAALLIAASWRAERQAECPADCGGDMHDEACRSTDGR